MKLAIHGGAPVREEPFPAYVTIGEEEKRAVAEVLDSGSLSRFLGCWHEDFHGGPQVRALEEEWARHFGARHAVAVNSCTSGLYCAVGASGVEPGEEIIVTPYTMSATATAALVFNAVPVFADIEREHFCLDPEAVEACITPRTRAIIVVDLFGLPYDAEAINAVAERHGLMVIEDAAQAPGARFRDRFAGTLADIGVYSLNYHKHIHCGEGGVVVTDDDRLAERVRLLRNHAEAVVEGKGEDDLVNMIGFNFRMTELEAAVARCQLAKLDALLERRQANCAHLAQRVGEIPAIKPAAVRDHCTHAYYVQPFTFDADQAEVSRDAFVAAVAAELPVSRLRENQGTLIFGGYVKPLYLQPMYQQRMAYGSRGCPFSAPWYDGEVSYEPGICPVAEHMHSEALFYHEMMHPGMTRSDLDDVVRAFVKVWEQRAELRP
jgi:dTDP-4-amino-4,6-dideoxygalactose transaminase